MNSDPDQIQLRYHRGTVYWQMPNARIKMKAILVGAYLGVSLAIILACVPAIYSQTVPDPAWVKAHQATYLWLAAWYFALVLFVRALMRWQGLGRLLVVGVFKFIFALLCIAIAGLFGGYAGAGIMLLCCLGVFDCCCEHERQREARIIVSRRPELPAAGLSLSRGEKRLLRACAITAGLSVWVLLGAWYMNDARTLGRSHTGLIDAPALPEPTPRTYSQKGPVIHRACVESTQNGSMRQCGSMQNPVLTKRYSQKGPVIHRACVESTQNGSIRQCGQS